MREIIDKLYRTGSLEKFEIVDIYKNLTASDLDYLMELALKRKEEYYSNEIFIRALIEISSFCSRSCRYCGINKNNPKASRFRLSKEAILSACDQGYKIGFRTFVLQGGEDGYFTDDLIVEIIKKLKSSYKDIAITLSLGERSLESYENFFKAGADRYLLRHETINRELFEKIHLEPSYNRRIGSLYELRDIGYAVGAGFMVGIPGQGYSDLADDILFLKKLNPEMVGLGPFIPHKDTIYRDEKPGSIRDSLISLALVRLFIPDILLPATTALSTLDVGSRDLAFKAGANVIMPNLSPREAKEKYRLYDGKLTSGIESAKELGLIKKHIESQGYFISNNAGHNARRKK